MKPWRWVWAGLVLTQVACQLATPSTDVATVEVENSPSVDTFVQLSPKPVVVPPDYDTMAWTELVRLDSTFVLDLRYATDSNFVGEQMYSCGRCFLRPAAAHSLAQIQDSLRNYRSEAHPAGLGFVLFDCYRPLPVQWRLWNKVPDRRYVADPRKGSQHNKGVAVDLTLVDIATGEALAMGTAYDYFGGEAWHRATVGFDEPIRSNRTYLLELMEGFGWKRTNSEWWHYSYPLSRAVAPIDSMEWACPPR